MGCFCHQAVTALQQKLQHLDQTTPAGASASTAGTPDGASAATPQETRQAQAVAAAASRLAAHGLPAAPWQPDPRWLTQKLPTPALGTGELATISALATLRSDAQAGLGMDLLQPAQAKTLARVVTTLNARLATLAKTTPPPDPAPWQRLAAQNEAADAVQQAAKNGLLDPSPEQIEAYSEPAGRPMQQWLPLLRQVRALAPLIAATSQLGHSLDQPEELAQRLAEALRSLRSVSLPPPAPAADPTLAPRLVSLLSAAGRLRQSLGVDPAETGYAAVQKLVAAKTAAAAAVLRQHQQQQAPPPNLPYCPTLLAPPAVLHAAASEGMNRLAAVTWKVPPADTLAALQQGLPAAALARQMTALGIAPVRQSPCGADCDAARIMRAADSSQASA